MTTHQDALTALSAAERAHAEALSGANAARSEFEERPSAKSHSAMVIAEQLARNAMTPVEAGRIEVERVRRDEIGKALASARSRASLDALIETTAPDRARLLALFTEALPLVARIESAVRAQNDASEEATDHAAALGVHPDVDAPVSVDLLRAMVGVVAAQWLVDQDIRVPHGRGFYRFLEPRWDRGGDAADLELIRTARALVIPDDAFDVRASVDFHHSAADIAPWESTPDDRPARWEI